MTRSWKLVPALAGLWLAVRAGLSLAGPLGFGSGSDACGSCKTPCPPFYIHHYEGGPKLKFKKACPRPICDPCSLPHYGYYQTCWAPWPYGPDWSHCRQPTPAQMLPPPAVPPYTPKVPVPREPDTRKPDEFEKPMKPPLPELPEPKKLDQTSYRPVPMPATAEPPVLRLRFVK